MDVEDTSASLNGSQKVEEQVAMANAENAVQRQADTAVYSFDPDESISAKREAINSDIVLPDFRNLGNKQTGLQTELGTSDVNQIKDALSAAQKKPVIQPVKTKHVRKPSAATPRTLYTPQAPQVSRIPEWYRVGWTALSSQPNPGGPFQLAASEKKAEDALERAVSALLYKDDWNHAGAVFLIGVAFWVLGKLGGGIVTFCIGFLFVLTFNRITTHRFDRHARDDIQRELIRARSLEQDVEPVEWLNSFLQEFWLIFEPVLSAYVIENIDTYLVDYLPGFLDSVRLTTFTLGSKPFRVENVKTIHETAPDTVCMDWTVTFKPEDTTHMSKTRIAKAVSPKVVLSIRLGKGMVGAGIPVLVEDMSFMGEMRVKLKFMSNFPHIKVVDACFMRKPKFDYVLKPIGGETFGFDVTNIPGLQSFVRDQVHAILGPMMYYPNVFSFDVEKFFSGELDITQANGVLAITVYYATALDSREVSGTVNPYIRFYLNKAQELGRTSTQYNTTEPRWNETHFLMLNNLNSLLSLELRNQTGGSKDRRIGRANFELKQLEDEHNYAREGLELDLRHNAKPLGRLKVDMRYLPVSKPVPRDDGTIEPPAESNSGILRFTVHECRNLGSPRISSYVRVLINGTERITTPIFKRNPNPKFERPGEVVVLDQTAVYIRVEVRESISFAEDPIIGVWKYYLVDMMQEMEANDGWWNLTMEDGTQLLGRIRLSVQWKPIVMTGLSEAMGGHGLYNPPVGVVKLVCWGAKDLRNVEGITSKSDPYVRVRSGAQVRARTEVVDNNLDPEWGETLYVPVHSHKEDLVLEVMDWEAKGKDRSLGFTVLSMKDLVRQRVKESESEEEDKIKWYESTGRKIDEWVPLRSSDRKTTKGELRYSAEFYPSIALPTSGEVPERDLHDCPIRRTPDNLVDLFAYNSGILTVKIHEVKLPHAEHAYCALIVDSLLPQFTTTKLKGRTLTFNETSDAFVKEADFSRVAIEVKPADATEKSDEKLGFWIGKVSDIVRQIQRKRRSKSLVDKEQDDEENQEAEDDGEWFELHGTLGGDGRIRLSFDFAPLINFTLDPSESLDNQGQLTVTLLDGKNLMAADKSGTSDPYVIFTVNGSEVHKSEAIKKTVNPVWKNETFTVPIQSRVTASFRLEVFDWNRFGGRVPLGSGGITLRGDMVESFVAKQVNIPLDGVAGVTGYIRVRFLWQPQLLIRKKTHTSVLGDTRLASTSIMPSPTSSNTLSPNSAAAMRPRNMLQPAPQTPPPAPSQLKPSLSITRPRSDSLQNLNNQSRHHQRTQSEASSIMSFQTIRGGGNETTTGVDGHVSICLVEARNLRGVDKSGTSDPFVRVRIGKSQVHKTKYVKKTLSPEWNETFQYSVSSKPTIIDFKVKDHNRFGSSVELGHCQWNLWELIQPQQGVTSKDQWLPLYPSGHGEIRVKIQFHQ